MSQTLLIILSVAEILALVVVLAHFVLIIAGQLRSISKTLHEVTWGARAVERQLLAVPANISKLNFALEEIARTVPAANDKAERLLSNQSGIGGPS